MRTHRSTVLARAIKKASKSTCRQHRVVAVGVDHTGSIIAIHSNKKRFYSQGGGWHAEELLIYRSPRSIRKVLIARVSKQGELLPIDPCKRCQKIANKFGIKIERLSQ